LPKKPKAALDFLMQSLSFSGQLVIDGGAGTWSGGARTLLSLRHGISTDSPRFAFGSQFSF
jgi:hypothetical protein